MRQKKKASQHLHIKTLALMGCKVFVIDIVISYAFFWIHTLNLRSLQQSQQSRCRCNELEGDGSNESGLWCWKASKCVTGQRLNASCACTRCNGQQQCALEPRLRSQGMILCSMHMLELPTSFIRLHLPNRTFFTIKSMARMGTVKHTIHISRNPIHPFPVHGHLFRPDLRILCRNAGAVVHCLLGFLPFDEFLLFRLGSVSFLRGLSSIKQFLARQDDGVDPQFENQNETVDDGDQSSSVFSCL